MFLKLLLRFASRKAHPPEPPVTEPGEPRAQPPHPVQRAALEGLRLYRNFDKLDRLGGGGLAISNLVKLAGWAGLLFILGTLVSRLHAVEQQLDPVSHGVVKLQQELDAAQRRIDDQAQVSSTALLKVGDDAEALRRTLASASAHQTRALAELAPVRDQEAALATQLQTSIDGAKAAAASESTLATVVANDGPPLESAKTGLLAALQRTSAASSDLETQLANAQRDATGLDQAVKAVDLAPTRAELANVQTQARALADDLAGARARVAQLDQLLDQRLWDERARRAVASREPAPEHASAPARQSPGPSTQPPSGSRRTAEPAAPASP